MRTFIVTMRATLKRSYEIVAEDEDEAVQKAEDRFSLLDEEPEDVYSEEVLDVEEVTCYRSKTA